MVPSRWAAARGWAGATLPATAEPGRRPIKRRSRPMPGFKRLAPARQTLAGVEAMAMLAKGQVRAVPRNDVPAQRAFVH